MEVKDGAEILKFSNRQAYLRSGRHDHVEFVYRHCNIGINILGTDLNKKKKKWKVIDK